MTATQAFKKRFVERKLLAMLESATDGAVTGLTYAVERGGEAVLVAYERVPLPPVVTRVDVTACGKLTIAREVTRAVEELHRPHAPGRR